MGEQEVTMSVGFGSQAGLALVIGMVVMAAAIVATLAFGIVYRLVVNARKKVVD